MFLLGFNIHSCFVCEQTLFDLLLRHFGDVTHHRVLPHKLLDGMTRHLYDLTQMSAQHAGRSVAELMADRYREFTAEKERHSKPRYPDFDVVCLLAYFPCSLAQLRLLHIELAGA